MERELPHSATVTFYPGLPHYKPMHQVSSHLTAANWKLRISFNLFPSLCNQRKENGSCAELSTLFHPSPLSAQRTLMVALS